MRCNLSFNPLLKCAVVTKLVYTHTCLCHLKTVIVMYAVCMTLTAPNFLDYTTPPFLLNCNYYPVNHILVLRKLDRSNLNTKKNKSNFHPKKKKIRELDFYMMFQNNFFRDMVYFCTFSLSFKKLSYTKVVFIFLRY